MISNIIESIMYVVFIVFALYGIYVFWKFEKVSDDCVEVVRCENCEKWDKYISGSYDDWSGYCRVCMMDTKKDHFCSYGERKEGDE